MASSDSGGSGRRRPVRAASALRLTVRGRVQGVGFRWWAMERAGRLGICGWVANRPDGSVEILAEGAPADLQAFAADMEKGPPLARVDTLFTRPCPAEGFRDFRVRGW